MSRWQSRTDLERFEEKYIIEDSGCWIWTGAGAKGGSRYGSFYFPDYPYIKSKDMVSSHKASLYLYTGVATSSEEHILHSCDNGFCVNPEHLSVGTHKDNMRDMMEKGRFIASRQKLDQVDVICARQMRRSGVQVKEIAEVFNISPSQMTRLTSGVLPKWIRNAWV